MMAMASRRWTEFCWVMLAALTAWFWMAHPALAQATGGWGDFSCSNGQASGTLYDAGSDCPTTLEFDNIFSFLVCNMEHLAANLMGAMYCGIVDTAVPAVEAALTLAVVFFGIAFTTGIIPATAREFQLFLVKVAFIWVLATQADYMIGVGYRFLVEGAREGIVIAISGMFADEGGAQATGADLYEFLDRFLGKAMEYASANVGVNWNEEHNPCQNALFAVIAMMALVFPPLFYVSVALMLKVALTFLRAVFGYIYAIVGLVFLITMAPLFLTFFLFRQTQPFFNKWMGYVVSFTLQMVIVFAFLAAVVSIDVSHITSSFVNIIVPDRRVTETTSFRFPWEYCTICDFEVVDNESGNVIDPRDYGSFLGRGTLRCRAGGDEALSPLDTMSGRTKGSAISNNPSGDAIRNTLIQFTATALLSLFVLAYVVDALLRYVPALAQYLSGGMGGTYAPQLGGSVDFAGGGRPVAHMPGSGMLNTLERGFSDGFVAAANRGETMGVPGTPGAVIGGFREAAARMLFGGRYRSEEVTDRFSGPDSYNDPGLVDSFFNFFINPQGNISNQ